MGEKLNKALVIADKHESVEELCSGASLYAEHVCLIYSSDREAGLYAEKAYYLDVSRASFASYVPQIRSLVKEIDPELILCAPSADCRLAAAAVAAYLGVCVISDCSELELEGGLMKGCHLVYGGAAVKTERCPRGPAIVCPVSGTFERCDKTYSENIKNITDPESGIRLCSRREKKKQSTNIALAKNVVGVGRGLGSEERLPMIQTLAELIGGEVGCTRPVAEENHWLPRERNLGISGASIKPGLYIACGISGQIQHMVGVNQSGVIAAINKDDNAAIFSACDFGIVGDINDVLPKLIEKFKQSNTN